MGLVAGARNFCCTAQFMRNFCSIARWTERINQSNATTIILMKKGIDATSRQFVVVQSLRVYCRKMRCSTVPETDKSTLRRSFCIHTLLLSARYLVTGMTHTSEAYWIGFALANRYNENRYNDLCNEFAEIS